MKKIYYLLITFLVFSSIGHGQTTIATQSFEGASNNWEYELTAQNTTNTSWGIYDVLAPFGTSGDGDFFLGYKNSRSSFTPKTINFETINVSLYNNIEISFALDYSSTGSTANSATGEYILIIDEGLATDDEISGFFITSSTTTGAYNIEIPSSLIPIDAETVQLSIKLDSRVATNVIALDDFKIEGTLDSFVGFLYDEETYTNGWRGNQSPSNTATSGETDCLILNGDVTFTSRTKVRNLTITNEATLTLNPGVLLDIGDIDNGTVTGGDLNADNNITLMSDSANYSSIYIRGEATGTGTYMRHVTEEGTNDLISSPFPGQTFGEFATVNNDKLATPQPSDSNVKLFGPFDKTAASGTSTGGVYLEWSSVTQANEVLTAGVGYRAGSKSSSDNLMAFTGEFTTDDVYVPVAHTPSSYASQWNLIGNPYACAMMLTRLLGNSNNAALFQTGKFGIYGYNGTFWTVYNLDHTTVKIEPGQGFYVGMTAGTNTNYEILESYRTGYTQTNDDFITGRTIEVEDEDIEIYPMLKLSLSSDETLKHFTEVFFNDHGTDGLDAGYDTNIYGNNFSGFTLYTQLVDNNSSYKLAIQTLPSEAIKEEGTTIALGVIAPAGEQITLDLQESTLDSNVNVYLEDTETNDWTLLNNTPFTITTEEKLNGLGRFYLHVTEEENLLSLDEESVLDNLQFITGNQSIKIKGLLEKDSKISIYDIQGRALKTVNLNTSTTEYTINTPNVSSGVYIVNIVNLNGSSLSKRVILK